MEKISGFSETYKEYCLMPKDIITKDYYGNITGCRIFHDLIFKYIEKTGKKDARILEVGCGTGRTLCYITEKLPSAEVYGIDISHEAIRASETTSRMLNFRRNLKFIQCDASNMPFPDGYFDVIFSQGTLEHFRDISGIINEQKRVLNKSGFLIINVPQTFSCYTIKKKIKMLLNKWKPGWETQYSYFGLKKLSRKYDLNMIEVKGQIYDSKLSELIKIYKKIIPPFFKKLNKKLQLIWHDINKRNGHLFLVEIIGVFSK